jgi:hypothetical protein
MGLSMIETMKIQTVVSKILCIFYPSHCIVLESPLKVVSGMRWSLRGIAH